MPAARVHDAWEGGERQGLRWRRAAALLLTAAAAAGLTWVALRPDPGLPIETDDLPVVGVDEEEQDVVVTAPLAAGDRWLCPTTHMVRTYPTGLYYPAPHPGAPAFTERPEACYVDPVRAERAGYRLAPTPPGVVRAGDFYLVRARRPGRAACADVATVAGLAAPCPTRLPSPGEGASCLNSCLFTRGDGHFGVIIEARGFPLPVGWCRDCEPHVVITAARGDRPVELVTCGAPTTDGDASPLPDGFHDCPEAAPWLPGIGGFPHERHTVLVWRRAGITYAVSLEGQGAGARDVLVGIQAGIELVAPGRR